MRQRSWDNYERGLRLRFSPAFGKRRIDTITSLHVEKWLGSLGELTPGQAGHLMAPLVAVMNYAHKHRLIQWNPCDAVEQPTKMPAGNVKRTGTFLTLAQVASIADHVAPVEPIYGLLVRFAAGTGLRRSGIAGLRIGDLELSRKPQPGKGDRLVQVRRLVERGAKGSWVTQLPKSTRSRRQVPILDDELLDDMGAYLAAHPRRFDPEAPVRPGKFRTLPVDYGTPDTEVYWNGSSFYKHAFLPAVAAAGLPATPVTAVRFHDLRHTCGSQWLQNGQLISNVSEWLGHHNIAFTHDVYIHAPKEPDYTAAIDRARAARARTAG